MKDDSFESLSNIDVPTLNQPISRSAGEGYQLDVHVCNAQESRLYTYPRNEALYRFGEKDHSDVLEALDAIFQTMWYRYGDEDEFAPTRCKEDGYEIHISVLDAEDCGPTQSDFRSPQQFTVCLNEGELVEDMDRLFAL